MVPVEHEQNIEILRQYTLLLQDQVKAMAKELAKVRNEKEAGREQWLDAKLKDQLSRLQMKFYGRGTETLLPDQHRPVGHPGEQLKLHGEYPTEGKEAPVDGLKPKGPVTFIYKMSERELARESLSRELDAGALAWEEAKGLYQDSCEITVFERVYQEVLHRQCKYRLKRKFNTSEKDQVLITAPGPAKLRAGSRYGIDFAVSVSADKFEYHLPLERQRRKMEAAGLKIDTKTLYGLCEAVAGHCNTVRERIRQDILADFCSAHVDESPWPIQGQESQSYMWVLSNRKGSYFQFEPTRSGKVAQEILKGYAGSVLTDGFSGYNRIKQSEGLRVGHCWSHARREFFERHDDYPDETKEALRLIDQLFAIEAGAKSFEELRRVRKTESTDVIRELHAWMLKTRSKYLSDCGLNRAISYCLKFWKELTLFLEDLSLPLSNNDAERALRHVVLGRKNFSGSKTINGADTAASIYTVIESCKKVGLQPSQYLKYLIEAIWYQDPILTPYERAMKILPPNSRVQFPAKSDWKV